MDSDPLPVTDSLRGAIDQTETINDVARGAIEFMAPDNWVAWSFIIFIALICLIGSAFFSGSEIAYYALRPAQLDDMEEGESPSGKRVARLMKDSERFLATLLISNNLVNVTMVVLLTYAISQTVVFHSAALNFVVQTVFLTFLLLLFGEIFPKLVAKGRPASWALKTSGTLTAVSRFLAPMAKGMAKSTHIINRLISKKDPQLSADELEKALEISDIKEGEEREMLEDILSFGEKEASEIMIPRVDVTDLEIHATWSEVMQTVVESGYSRIPVYDTSQDTIKGILYAKDLLPHLDNRTEGFEWQKLIREAYFVPESRMIDDLLEDFRTKRIHIAIVVDEYGGTQGIVTLEDIIEEILGEIDDEYDQAARLYRKLDDHTWIFDAKIPIGDFCEVTGIEEEDLGDIGDCETLAGLILHIKADFPEKGEELTLSLPARTQAREFEFKVLSMERHRILKIKVTKI
ncbi:MAG: gliding motility-associated protein GldE [Muribaculaceae bacterium]|nr:gliding motility-associated protein GldE [Muribaculaceae bacterium]